MKPLVTVAIPVYNGKRYIHESIQSVLDQTFADFELIITDDGSTDGTMEIVRTFQDPRIRVIADGVHKGLAIRLNEQIADARGVFFARMDADDVMMPQRLERQVQFFSKHSEADVVGASTVVIDENGNRIGWRGSSKWKRGAKRKPGGFDYEQVDSFMHPTVMGKTNWFRKYYYNPTCEGCEDMDLWYRSRRKSVFYSLCEPLLYYRDPQVINLPTYLYRRQKERYVLRINSGDLSWMVQHLLISKSYLKSIIVWFLCTMGAPKWVLQSRNECRSPLNNNLLHVITSLRTGGAEKLLVDLLPRLRSNDLSVELLVFDGVQTQFYQQLQSTGIKIHSLSVERSVYDIRNLIKILPYLTRYDFIHTHNTAPQMFVAMANKLLLPHNRPIVVTTEHSTSNRRRAIPALKWLDRWMYRKYRTIVTVSDVAGDNIKNYVSDNSLPTQTIPNGIDVSKFMKAEPAEELINQYGSFLKLMMVAGFRYEKDQKTVIKALRFLDERVHLFLVGDGDLRKDCEKLVLNLSLEQRVHFLGIRSDVPNLLKAADIVIMSSHREGLSLSNLEGMACGRPFVASDVDGLHEIVNGYGVLVPHEDPEAMAQAIKKLVEDPEYTQSVAKRCQERAAQFDIEVMTERYNELYSAED